MLLIYKDIIYYKEVVMGCVVVVNKGVVVGRFDSLVMAVEYAFINRGYYEQVSIKRIKGE